MSSLTPEDPVDARDVEGSGLDGRDSQALSGAWYPDEQLDDAEWSARLAADEDFDRLLADDAEAADEAEL